MNFKEGWYRIRVDAARCAYYRYYISTEAYTCLCRVESSGQQVLLWYTSDPAKARRDPLSSDYIWQPATDDDDWWDNPQTASAAEPDLPENFARSERTPTARELCQRAAMADGESTDGLSCTNEVHVGIFFDGTNNNMERDKPVLGHSNIVSLYEAHKDDRSEHFAYYIPGVGARFAEIGELTEDSSGKTFAAGGEARIHWAMLLVYNAVCRAATGRDLLTETEMTKVVTSTFGGLSTKWRLGDAKIQAYFPNLDKRLLAQVADKRPRITKVNLSVFGFSRGAAEARTFCTWLQLVTKGQIGPAALELRFLGIFDTVASVGLADSSPVGSGFLDWADDTQGVSGVQRCVHYVAGHEIRRSFPVSIARASDASAVAGAKEYIYPGAHSDIGGGYCPGDQGKSRSGRSSLLSQIALGDMYFHALNAGVKLFTRNKMRPASQVDFEISPDLDRAFADYLRWASVDAKSDDVSSDTHWAVTSKMKVHMRRYWQWRASKDSDAKFKALSSFENASAQDQADLWDSEKDWRVDMERARTSVARAEKASSRKQPHSRRPPMPASQVDRDVAKAISMAHDVPVGVDRFLDRYVHDSHASFYLLGPLGEFDRRVFVEEVRRKQKLYDAAMTILKDPYSVRIHDMALRQARQYELNHFEKRVLEMNQGPGKGGEVAFPVMTDANASDLRDNMGASALVVKYLMGSGTRREANGHGQYRRVFSKS